MILVGLVGFGMAGRVFHAPLISSVDGLELAAVVERHSTQAEERYPGITTYKTLESMLADRTLGLIVVATPSGSHFDVARTDNRVGPQCPRRQADGGAIGRDCGVDISCKTA